MTYGDKLSGGEIDGQSVQSGEEIRLEVATEGHTIRYQRRTLQLRVLKSALLPTIFITTESGEFDLIHASTKYKEPGSVAIYDEAGGLTLSSELEHVKGRGNSSFMRPKKPYQIKFLEKTSLFGMEKAKKWVLLANYKDRTLIRNQIVFGAARYLGDPYASSDAYADLYVNTRYMGTYEISGKVEIAGNRIDVRDLEKETEALNELPLSEYKRFGRFKAERGSSKGYQIPNDPQDITGGYLIEFEKSYHYEQEKSGFVTKRGQCFVIKSPEFASQAQVAYISGLIQRLENAIYAADGRDPETGLHYSEMADLDSMAREFLMEEVFKNYDANKSSQFIVKPADSEGCRLFFGPVWDFDLSMGDWCDNADNRHIASPKRLYAANGNGWLPTLYKQRDFYERVIRMYYEELAPYLKAVLGEAPQADIPVLEERYEMLRASADMNYLRWPSFDSASWPVDTGRSFEANYAYLRAWLEQRMEYLDTIWLSDYQTLSAKAEEY